MVLKNGIRGCFDDEKGRKGEMFFFRERGTLLFGSFKGEKWVSHENLFSWQRKNDISFLKPSKQLLLEMKGNRNMEKPPSSYFYSHNVKKKVSLSSAFSPVTPNRSRNWQPLHLRDAPPILLSPPSEEHALVNFSSSKWPLKICEFLLYNILWNEKEALFENISRQKFGQKL